MCYLPCLSQIVKLQISRGYHSLYNLRDRLRNCDWEFCKIVLFIPVCLLFKPLIFRLDLYRTRSQSTKDVCCWLRGPLRLLWSVWWVQIGQILWRNDWTKICRNGHEWRLCFPPFNLGLQPEQVTISIESLFYPSLNSLTRVFCSWQRLSQTSMRNPTRISWSWRWTCWVAWPRVWRGTLRLSSKTAISYLSYSNACRWTVVLIVC